MAYSDSTEWEDYITWRIKNFPSLIEKGDGFAEFSPPFYMPETQQTEWQLELTTAYDYEQYLVGIEKSSAAKKQNCIDLRLRLIQKDPSVFQQGSCTVLIFCLFMNTEDEYLITFYKRETFNDLHTSWSSQDISFKDMLSQLKDGILQIRVKLELINKQACYMPSHKISQQIHENLKKMQKYGLLTDAVLTDMDGNRKKVHQCVLCSRSKKCAEIFMNTQNRKSFNAHKCDEIETTLKAPVLDLFIKFIYSGNLPTSLDLTIVFELLEAAIEYCIEDLKNTCEDILTSELNEHNTLDILAFADKWRMLCLKKRTLEFINTHKEEFSEESSFTSIENPRLLKEIVAYIAGHSYTTGHSE